MTKDELYEELWAIFKPLEAGLDPERKVALDGLIDAAARKLAAKQAVATHIYSHLKIYWSEQS